MQKFDIVHSDVKPENIALGPDGVKVIDFGIALTGYTNLISESATLKVGGTFPYFSPLLNNAYREFLAGNNPGARVNHNPYKSDVYSLGLTFYSICSLRTPNGLNEYGDGLQEKVTKEISALSYGQPVKQILTRMLTVREEARPDFIELYQFVQKQADA